MARRLLLLCVLPALLGTLAVAAARGPASPSPPSVKLLIVGGGGTPPEVLAKGLELAGGKDVDVVVLPFASEREDRGAASCAMWLEAGAATAVNLDHASPEEAVKAIRGADLVWMPGGSQSRLMEGLGERGLLESVLEATRSGQAVLGGTSAGAAVMSKLMIARSAEEDALVRGRTPLGEGLGLFPGAIFDQHFLRRGRNVRLLQTVLDHPECVGFGIDERTALVTRDDHQVEVLGEGQVVVYDARTADVGVRDSDGRQRALDVRVSVLVAGDRMSTRRPPAEWHLLEERSK